MIKNTCEIEYDEIELSGRRTEYYKIPKENG